MLDKTFKIKNLGDLMYFLRLEFARANKGFHLCQHKYTLDLFSDNGMVASTPVSTPMNFSNQIYSTNSLLIKDLLKTHLP